MVETLTTSDDPSQITFQYANECDLEIHCSPFGLSGLYIKVNGTNLMGIGSAMGLITGSSKGLIHYNDSNDFLDQKYKLYVIVDDEGFLRIDFTKILTFLKDKLPEASDGASEGGTPGANIESTSSNISGGSGNVSSSATDISPESVSDHLDDGSREDTETPTLIYRGKCPPGRPDHIEPFIGMFLFERED